MFDEIELSIDNELDGENDTESKKEDPEKEQLYLNFDDTFRLMTSHMVLKWNPFQVKTLNTALNIKTPPPKIFS